MLRGSGGQHMETLLSLGRLAARSVVTTLHSKAALGDYIGERELKNADKYRRKKGVEASADCSVSETNRAAATGETLVASQRRRYVNVCCGFPKDLLFGASTVRDQTAFGDDACFMAAHCSAHVVGVADGVGGWRSYGIDPSKFSRSLMEKCKELVESGQFAIHQPAQLLAEAFFQLYTDRLGSSPSNSGSSTPLSSSSAHPDIPTGAEEEENAPLIGSSTACVIVLDKTTSKIHTANLGDSGFLVIRNGRVVHQSVEQCHYFNAPFQLALPPKIPTASQQSNTSDDSMGFLSDSFSPEMAETSSFEVEVGDMILVATDGLFDNLSVDSIEKELSSVDGNATEASLQGVCNSLALQARRLAFDQQYMSPFAKKAERHGYSGAVGGKPDDITVILVLVTKAEPEQTTAPLADCS